MSKKSLVAALAVALVAAPASAEQIAIQVGYSPGGSYDLTARLVADHIGKYLPGNPDIVVENVPGAGSLKLAKLFMETGATDGSQIAVVSSALALLPIFEPDNTDFDPRRVHYLASLANEASHCVTHKNSGIETLDEFLQSDAKVGSTGRSSSTYTYPAAIKAALGGTFEIVTGFEGGEEINLAMERGDIQARCGISLTTLMEGDMIERVNVIAELAPEPAGLISGAEFLLDRAPDEATRAALSLVFSSGTIHHPFIAAPDTPEDIVAMLRTAFDALSADVEFLAEAERRKIFVSITGGAEVEAKITGFLASDPALIELARKLVE
jgi:tripartite-type tricarboxylate transporter receptor subunit TctC